MACSSHSHCTMGSGSVHPPLYNHVTLKCDTKIVFKSIFYFFLILLFLFYDKFSLKLKNHIGSNGICLHFV